MADYCNTTTDLQRVFANIEDYQSQIVLEDWTLDSGHLYKKPGTGYVSAIFFDGVQNDVWDTIQQLTGNDEGAYYDENNDTLYVITPGQDSPDNYVISIGEDWDSFKSAMRYKAQQMIDSFLASKYVVPLLPRSRQLHDSADYEYPIVYATACYTCYLIISRVSPRDPAANELLMRVVSKEEPKGIIPQLLDGDMVLQDQIIVRETGSWNVYPSSSNSVTRAPIFTGNYTGSYKRMWRIQVDADGAPGTGTFKVSYDGGTNWDLTEQDMKDASEDEIRMYISQGIYVEWPNVSYTTGDYWDLELFPATDVPTNEKISSIGLAL